VRDRRWSALIGSLLAGTSMDPEIAAWSSLSWIAIGAERH